MFHHDSLRSGLSQARAPLTPTLAWAYQTGAQVYASPAVVDGVVFIPSYDGKLYAIDEYSGRQKWVFTSGASIYASPAVSNGLVYLASRDGFLYAIDEQTGVMVWRVGNISPLTSSPVVADGKVFYGTWFVSFWAQFMALNAYNGTVLWQYLADDTIISSPAVHNGRVFFGQNNGYVVALNETTGSLSWKASAGGTARVTTAPTIANGLVYVGTDNRFVAMSELTGSIVWTFNTNNTPASSGAVHIGTVYFGTGKGDVRAVNATDGRIIWTYSVGVSVSSSPAVALGSQTLLVGASNNYLYALNLTSGGLAWRYLTGATVSSSPAVADGRVFFGSEDFKVYSLGPRIQTLRVTLTTNVTSLKPGGFSILTVSVTNDTGPAVGATISFSSTLGGIFSQAIEKTSGVYESNYTAPVISIPLNTTITSTASLSGFIDGGAQIQLALNPFPSLTVSVSPNPATVAPGGEVSLLIHVSNGTIPMPGATIVLIATSGSVSRLVDAGNGDYTAVYSSPFENSNPTVTVQASKEGFIGGQAQTTISVYGVPDLNTIRVLGFPLLILLAILALLLVFLLVVALAKRGENRRFDEYHN